MSDIDNELVVNQYGPVVQAILNRPQVLNALSLEMIRMLSANLSVWSEDENIKAVFIDGAENKSFCAGGDVKNTYRTGMSYRQGKVEEQVISLFFGEEYRFNKQLFHYEKPIFAFMDGITMGGGYGVAGPCRYRIATENTVFAMPEVAIGFFPDVGSTYYLSRCPGQVGTYLALTGSSIGPGDMIYCGLASHYIPSHKLEDVKGALVEAFLRGNDPEVILDDMREIPPRGWLEEKLEQMNSFYDGNTVEEILQKLRDSGVDWAHEHATIIESRSPISLKISLAHLLRAEGEEFDKIIERDFILAQHFMRGHDFYEGVRAVLVDKDKNPKWQPETLEAVGQDIVDGYFGPASLTLDEIAA